MNPLKQISVEAIPRALELAERYRLLNEPEQASSICHDILEIQPDNHEALRTLFLATTEQFHQFGGASFSEAEWLANRMPGEYEPLYYGGIACERWARSRLQTGAHAKMAGDWLHRAMELYEKAEAVRPAGNDDAMLRWNACARLLNRVPGLRRSEDEHATDFGD
jgi:hypothetical protein